MQWMDFLFSSWHCCWLLVLVLVISVFISSLLFCFHVMWHTMVSFFCFGRLPTQNMSQYDMNKAGRNSELFVLGGCLHPPVQGFSVTLSHDVYDFNYWFSLIIVENIFLFAVFWDSVGVSICLLKSYWFPPWIMFSILIFFWSLIIIRNIAFGCFFSVLENRLVKII